MTKKIKILLTAVLLLLSTLVFAETGPRVYENGGGFSYRPPAGWNVTEYSGLKYKVVLGSAEGNFTTNINFVDETYNGSLRSYVDLGLAHLEEFFQSFRLVSRDTFVTNSGITGERVIINNSQNDYLLRQIFYFLPMPNNKYMIFTCSVIDSAAARYLPVFDESAKTFELIP